MLQEPSSQKSQICPTCGTRLTENATRCLVCGTELTAKAATKSKKADTSVQASRMPEITLSLPAALGALVIILLVGAITVYFVLKSGLTKATLTEPTPAGTATTTATITPTGTDIPTATSIPTETPLPPFEYTVRSGETCGVIAATFHVSTQSLIVLNQLSSDCLVSIGQKLKVPYPTATPAPPPTDVPNDATQTAQACE
jgi:LysM repeat protein